MSKRKRLKTKFYMVRLEGGEWSPKAKHESLAEAIQEAARLSKESGKNATVLMTSILVKTEGDKVFMEDVNPEL
jgi:hypothetical protein